MSFRDMVAADNENVFLNCGEFARERTVIYDGEKYYDVPVTLTKRKQRELTQLITEHTEGMHLSDAVAHFSLESLGGVLPKQGRWIEFSDGEALGEIYYRRYRILLADCEMGMVRLELEAVEE